MMPLRPFLNTALMISALLLGVGVHGAEREHTRYPLTIDNCGHEQTFTAPPKRIVTLGQLESELLMALGVADRIKGTSVWLGPVSADLHAVSETVPVLSRSVPSFESVTQLRPDLVAAQFTYHLGKRGEVATREQFEQLGIATWVSPSDCLGKQITESSNSDGARKRPFTMAMIRDEISQLARILDVIPQGQALTERLDARLAAAQHLRPHTDRQPTVLYWFSSTRLQGDAWVGGSYGAPEAISRALGLKNVIESDQEWPAVSWERIADLNPDIIVIASMDRRNFAADDAAKKRAFLESDPVARELSAVKSGHVITVDAQGLNPSMHVLDAMETIAEHLDTARVAE
ncbi:ABC transporter substrate-binding protein [Larsenimonas suaedae]|uniref:ABC transporter substrate-binding protein n=1 Tax=Larsenimonas suaedae TaxID=1851019 RepID=A0ABU1GVC3_9GAMM|nr:ABC transporter substrate-binding protein [Larsenimonas suaedae]MCM2971257.1 ABC transporter substrate-binding protein [Larsenimonas suaedae]MDR5895966.1 ABC transporter substrate-binding protein [Larsenimonas suaedae]